MSGFGNTLRNLKRKIEAGMRSFMVGRYGSDKLNTTILMTGVVLALAGLVVPIATARLALTAISYGLMFLAIFRCLSRNTYRRYRENCRYMRFLERMRDREHRYFECPRCHQPVRVPKGKGKIAITCPKCAEKFIKKT